MPKDGSGKPLGSLPMRKRLERLGTLCKGKSSALILTHDNPDPDSIAAACALTFVLEQKFGLEAQVGYGGIIGRAENLALVKELRLPIIPVSQLVFDEFDLLGLVDAQPIAGNHSIPARYTVDIVVDHHPQRDESLLAPYADVGGDYGATSTILVEYLRAARLEPARELATALLYGIKADTRDLGRETTPTDIEAYLWLFRKVDKRALSRIEHPELPARYFQLFHRALEKARVYGDAIVSDLDEVYSPDVIAEVAERMVFLERLKWSVALGSYRGQLYASIRTNDRRMNAGRLIREICEDLGGSSGGHGSMAGARIPLRGTKAQRTVLKKKLIKRFLEGFGVGEEKPTLLLNASER